MYNRFPTCEHWFSRYPAGFQISRQLNCKHYCTCHIIKLANPDIMNASTLRDTWLVQVGDGPRQADGDVPSASAVYRHISAKDGFPTLESSTLYEVFTRSVAKYPNNKCLGSRSKKADGTAGDYEWKTYKEVGDEVVLLASGLNAVGMQPKRTVGVFGSNCPEWMIAMQACNRINAQCVPLYDSLGENAIEFIIQHSESSLTFVSTDKFPALAKALSHDNVKSTLKTIVYWGAGHAESIETAKSLGYQLYSFEELKKLGADKPSDATPPSPDDLCTIMYTSGTTGDPKGVMIKHSAVCACLATLENYCKYNNIIFDENDSLLSYLPLAHIFDRVNEEMFLNLGGCIGYWQGDVNKLLDDVAVLKPALFVGVPRVFDRIYSRVMGMVQTSSFIKRTLFNWGLSSKMANMRLGKSQKTAAPLFDKIVFSKVAARLGGKVKAIVSGGAPLAAHAEEFLRTAMCCPVVQGYGLTETCAASFIASADVIGHSSTVGPPTPCVEFRLESVPDMKYDALDADEPKGEVLIRGPLNFSGYYKNQEMTDEVLEKDGWFHTGDIAMVTKEGALKIVDRKKNIFKLSQGEYVAVEKVESVYKKNLLVEQVWVYGSSFKSCLVAVVVPSTTGVKAWAASLGITGDVAAICADPKAKAAMLAELVATGKAEKLKGFELVKALLLEPEMFSIEDELLTPTFKLKRPQLQKKYQKNIDEMYGTLKD